MQCKKEMQCEISGEEHEKWKLFKSTEFVQVLLLVLYHDSDTSQYLDSCDCLLVLKIFKFFLKGKC